MQLQSKLCDLEMTTQRACSSPSDLGNPSAGTCQGMSCDLCKEERMGSLDRRNSWQLDRDSTTDEEQNKYLRRRRKPVRSNTTLPSLPSSSFESRERDGNAISKAGFKRRKTVKMLVILN